MKVGLGFDKLSLTYTVFVTLSLSKGLTPKEADSNAVASFGLLSGDEVIPLQHTALRSPLCKGGIIAMQFPLLKGARGIRKSHPIRPIVLQSL